MRLTERAINKIKDQRIKLLIALALEVTERAVSNAIENNSPNGPLTKAAAIKVIKKETGLKISEILDQNKMVA